MKEKINNFIENLKERRKVTVSDPSSFQPKFAIVLSKGAYILVLFSTFLLIMMLAYLIISYTSLKYLIPGYPTIANREEVYRIDQKNMELLGELEEQAKNRDLWIQNLQAILMDNDAHLLSDVVDSIKVDSSYRNIIFQRPIEDSFLRSEVKAEEELIKRNELKGLLNKQNFLIPVEYIKHQRSYNSSLFLTEINSTIISCMKGVVIGRDNQSVIIQHTDDLVSLYKNCGDIQLNVGEEVSRGKELGIVRDSVFMFELWHKGKPVDIKKVTSQ